MSNRVIGLMWFVIVLVITFVIMFATMNPEITAELSTAEQAIITFRLLVDVVLSLLLGMVIGALIVIGIGVTIIAATMIWTGKSLKELMS
jgi:hypothetical protein